MFAELKLNQEGKHGLVRESRTKTQTFLLPGSLTHEGPEKASFLGRTTHAVNQNNNNNENSNENLLSTSCAVY